MDGVECVVSDMFLEVLSIATRPLGAELLEVSLRSQRRK